MPPKTRGCASAPASRREADEAAGAPRLTPRGELRVYRQLGISRFIAEVVAGFLDRYSAVSVDPRTGDVIIDRVQERFDLAIMPWSTPDSTLVRRRLAEYRHLLCRAPAYLEKHSAPRSPADLPDHNRLLYTHSIFGREWPFLDSTGNARTVRMPGNLVTTRAEAMRAAAVAGVGLWLAPPYIVSDLLASGALAPVLRDHKLPDRKIVALYPHRRHMTAKVRAFLDMLVDRFAAEQRSLEQGLSADAI